MARVPNKAQNDPAPEGPFAVAAAEWKWETVVEESATLVLFDEVGDVFVGQFIGDERIKPDNGGDEFERFIFIGPDGERYAINKSYKLDEGMKKVEPGQWCRITYIKDIPTSRKLNPLKDFRVDVRR